MVMDWKVNITTFSYSFKNLWVSWFDLLLDLCQKLFLDLLGLLLGLMKIYLLASLSFGHRGFLGKKNYDFQLKLTFAGSRVSLKLKI